MKKTSNRAQICEALKAAKQFLAATVEEIDDRNDKHEFICHALEEAWAGYDLISYQAHDAAAGLIMDRIGTRHYSACIWLRSKIGYEAVDLALKENPNAVQEWRHRWLDSLIKEFSK